jgi:uncharacterized protein
MYNADVVEKVSNAMRELFMYEGTGHDWYHSERVRKVAGYIAKKENADLYVVDLGALLHDVKDFKFNLDFEAGPKEAVNILHQAGEYDEYVCSSVAYIVKHVSFKGVNEPNKINEINGYSVQDVDRLDALGAIGIARALAYGGSVNRPIHDPELKPIECIDFDKYKYAGKTSINHFLEKVVHIKDMMNTETGKQLAEVRHNRVIQYLNDFHEEWDCKLE